MKIQVQYTTMIVKNLDESVAFYRDVLGFREGYHVDTPDGGAITIMETDGASVELICNQNYPIGCILWGQMSMIWTSASNASRRQATRRRVR